MANIPGTQNPLPGTYSDTVTQTRGVSVPGGARIAAIIGEGSTNETLVPQALGTGLDGLDPTYSSSSGADGRHFQLSNFPLISARTKLYKNGVLLTGLEDLISDLPFNTKYDYRVDISTGQIELQKAYLQDLGGSLYTKLASNTGDGYLSSLELLDLNAPSETWSIRCISVQRNGISNPIAYTAKFLAFGSVSGALVDANGNPFVWVSNGAVVSNGTISFAIFETTPFIEGDVFTIKISSGVLSRGDTLTSSYIPELTLNDPVLLQDFNAVVNRHGLPTSENTLSLGAQLAFSNAAPALMTVQAAPAMPRRTSIELDNLIKEDSVVDNDYIFPLPSNIVPDADSSIHFFVTNPTTKVETQILPNKLEFNTIGSSPTLTGFINSTTTYDFYYSVIQDSLSLYAGEDGYIGRVGASTGLFSVSSVVFPADMVGKTLKVTDALNSANISSYTVSAVAGGVLSITKSGAFAAFTNASSVSFQVINPTTGLAVGAATDGVVTTIGTPLGTLSSASTNFTTIQTDNGGDITQLRLKISGSTVDNGLYDITILNSATQITIKKVLVSESSLEYNLVDTSEQSSYVVINQSVATGYNGYELRVSVIDEKDASFFDSGWINAIDSLELVECDIVVPLPRQTISVVVQNTLNHCLSMSNILNRRERIMFTGGLAGLLPANVLGTAPAAVEDLGVIEGIQGDSVTEVLAGNIEDLADYSVSNAFGHTYRAVYFYPDEIVVNANGTNISVDGMYIAAAAAGYLAADVNIQNPLTNKVLSGFTILRSKRYSQQTLRDLTKAGITVLQPVSGGGRVVWGLTTSQSGFVEEQEISIVFIRDRVAKTMRSSFAGVIGKAEGDISRADILTRSVLTLNSMVSQKLITAYKDLTVARDEADPTQWNIGVRVQPSYPINFIYIKINVGKF